VGDADAQTPWRDAPRRVYEPGEVVVREGEQGDIVMQVVDGCLEVLLGPEMSRVDVIGPGETCGEIAVLAGRRRVATVRALERTVVRQLEGERYRRWLAEDVQALASLSEVARSRIDRHRLIEIVSDQLDVDTETAADIVGAVDWVRVDAGDVVCTEGEQGDAAFVVVTGRFCASRGGTAVVEIGHGQIFGEPCLIAHAPPAPRTSTVTALRTGTVGRIDAERFRRLTATHPALLSQLTRTTGERQTQR
jgi:CRP-like cAMP-binding protein